MNTYAATYKIKFGKVLNQLSAHIFIYRCSECFKELNKCFCYCKTCRTYLRFCHQNCYDKDSAYEDDPNDITQMGFVIQKQCILQFFCFIWLVELYIEENRKIKLSHIITKL